MDIIPPIIHQPYHVTPVVPTKGVDGAVQHNLLPQQVVQTTVLSAESNQVVLDFGKYTMAANTQQPLVAGQKLKLQVVSTEPQLQFQVVEGKGDPSILRLLHLFDHRSELGSQLSNLLNQRPSVTNNSQNQGGASPALSSTAGATGGVQNGRGLNVPQPVNAQTSTPVPTQGASHTTSSATSTRAASINTMGQVANQRGQVPPTTDRSVVNQAVVKVPSTQGGAATLPPLSSPSSLAGTAPSVLNHISAAQSFTPLQRQTIEGALLPQQWGQLEQLSTQLSSEMSVPNRQFVVNLARMLGLDFEALLKRDQLDPAHAGLKGVLTELKSHAELPEAVRDSANQMSQQLELFQLCRLRLAQDGILFLPLPLEFIEQGYVLFEQQGQGADGDSATHGHLVSLNLTLKQLGNMQVNLLFEHEALFVRIKCQDETIAQMVENDCAELRESLQPFSIRSIQVTADAEDPALALLDRLQPQTEQQTPIFDARV